MMKKYDDSVSTDEMMKNRPETDQGKVMITAEYEENSLHTGDRLKLVNEEETYMLKDENNCTVNASLCVNIPEEIAYHLSRVKAEFVVQKTAFNVFRAVLTNPCSLVHHGCMEWWCIS